MKGISTLSLIPVRKEPSDRAEMVTQILFGEQFEVIERKERWTQVRLDYDDYTGWIDSKQFTPLDDKEAEALSKEPLTVALDLLQLAICGSEVIPVIIGSSLPFFQENKFHIGQKEYSYEGAVGAGFTPAPSRIFPAPSRISPAPSRVSPAPSGATPAPSGATAGGERAGVNPAPTIVEPARAGVNPVPTIVEPTRAGVNPAPTIVEPARAGVNPAPTIVEPARAGVNPAPTIVEHAFLYLNAPYFWGGRSPFGIDCSGFTQIVFKLSGIRLKRDAYQQAEQGFGIKSLKEARECDLAFFKKNDDKITHTGIILSGNRIIHASGRVRIDKLDENGILNTETNMHSHTLATIRRMKS